MRYPIIIFSIWTAFLFAACSRNEEIPALAAESFLAEVHAIARAEVAWRITSSGGEVGELVLKDWLVRPRVDRGIPEVGAVLAVLPHDKAVEQSVDYYAVFYIKAGEEIRIRSYLPVIKGRVQSIIGPDNMEIEIDVACIRVMGAKNY